MSAPKVLVVDDSRTVRTVVAKTLAKVGYETITASDGVACLELVRQQVPDLAILDIQMPRLDGYGVCQEFQRMGSPFSEIPILFLTTLDSNALELLAEELGAYLQKPVHPKLLIETVAQFLPLSNPSGSNSVAPQDSGLVSPVTAAELPTAGDYVFTTSEDE